MSAPKETSRKPRRWLRWLKWIGVSLALLATTASLLAFYLYHNLTGLVVWFANSSHPKFLLELGQAGFVKNGRIEFQNLTLKSESHPVLAIEKAVVDFRWSDLWHHRIGSISVENPQVVITDQVLAPATASEAEKAAIQTPDGLWLVDAFQISGGKAEVNISNSPVIRFGFASDLHGIYLSSDTRFSTQSQTLNVSNVEFLGKEAKPLRFGTIKAITARFSLDHIAQNKVDDISIETPSLWLNPALLATFGSGNPATAKAAPPGPAATPAASPSPAAVPATPWVVGKLSLTDGQFFMNGFGNKVPSTSCKFAMNEQDLQFGSGASPLADTLHKAQIWDVRVAAAFAQLEPFFWIGSAQVDFTAAGVFGTREIAGVTITHLDFLMGQKFRSFLAAIDQPDTGSAVAPQKTATPPAVSDANPWVIRKFSLINGRATLAELGDDMPNIAFKLDTEMKDVALSKEIRHASREIEEVDISDLTIHSPHDPFVPVLNFATIRVRFSLAQILDQEIDALILDKPTIFVGEQLFWYGDELKRRQAQNAPAAPAAPLPAGQQPAQGPPPQAGWRINKFSVEGGQLVIANAGYAGVAMPFEFTTEADDVQFNNLSDLQLNVKLVINKADYLFPSYQLEFKQLEGGIDFGIPPGTNARDVVQTLHAAGAKWKQFDASKLWLAITYDSKGIYGKFGGAGYGGYVTGQFQFYMLADTPWTGWVTGNDINLQGITSILAPQSFEMSGPADFNLEVNGLNHDIQRVAGSVKTRKGGKLKIAKLDEVISKIPGTWSGVKQGATRITLETLRDFDYTTGDGDFWYAGDKGHLALKVRGPNGSRNFDIALHGDH